MARKIGGVEPVQQLVDVLRAGFAQQHRAQNRRRPPAFLHTERRPVQAAVPYGIFVELDNEVSEDSTVIEIFSPDRMGLLYDISHCMFEKGVKAKFISLLVAPPEPTFAEIGDAAFGILTDFRTRMFPGSARLVELADRMQVLQVDIPTGLWVVRMRMQQARGSE